jgi:hypothetical protein
MITNLSSAHFALNHQDDSDNDEQHTAECSGRAVLENYG